MDPTRPLAAQAEAYAIRRLQPGDLDALDALDALGGADLSLLAPDQTPIARALAGEVVPARRGLVRAPGATEDRVVETFAAPLRDATGAICGAIAVFNDVTAQVQAEQALEHNERRYRALTERAMDIVGILAADGTIKYVSPSVQHVLGYQPEEVLGRNGFAFVHPDDRAAVERVIGEVLRTPGAVAQVRARLRHRDGCWRVLEIVDPTAWTTR